QEAARHLGSCPKCQEKEVILYQKVATCTSEACDFKLWVTIAKKKLTATQLKEIIQNGRTSQPVRGLKGQKGSFEATIVLKEDFTTGFEFSEKKKTTYKRKVRRKTS
ncbi:TPA: type IA DNA topoisomerase, partial [Enterococcus faecium]|nr:type IA DNA topoisomerase [Enterococcus faecium]